MSEAKLDDKRKAIGMYLSFLRSTYRALPDVMVGPVHHDMVRICSQMMDRMDASVNRAVEGVRG